MTSLNTNTVAGLATSLCSAAICSGCGLGLVMRATALPRGVADVEDQLRGLAKGRAKPTQCGAG
jgi:hypothetical protein